MEIIGDYDDVGVYTDSEGDPIYGGQGGEPLKYYPACCGPSKFYVRRYNGIRYKVRVCLKNKTKTFICVASDFIKYEKKDRVLLGILIKWGERVSGGASDCLCMCPPDETGALSCSGACKGRRRNLREQDETIEAAYGVTLADAPDGTYMIMPFTLPPKILSESS
jgi:hypothetical protein